MTLASESKRRLDTCPRCGAEMQQHDPTKSAAWSMGELAADLARCTEDDMTWLIWFSECPQGCHQCFRCLEWLGKDETCPRCPACPDCGGPMMIWLDEDDDGVETESLGCVRCSDAADKADAEAGQA